MPAGDFIHRFVPATGATSRTLLLLHGTGGNENDLLPLGRAIDANAALLSPRGSVLENGMPRFFRRAAEGVFDVEDLVRRTHELADFVNAAAAEYQLVRDQIIAIGYSNGANIAASMLLLRPEGLPAAVLFRAMVPLVPDELPDLSGKRILITAGEDDPIIDPRETQRLAQMLSNCGADVQLQWQAAGHQLTARDIEQAKSWLGLQPDHEND